MVRAFEPPVYCYHEIVHNQLVVDRFRALGVVFVDDIAEVPPGRPIMLVGPRLGARGRGRGPSQRRLRRRRRVPAGHQGPPRGEGAGRQGLPDRLRRPRGPRGGGRHDGRRARGHPPRRDPRRGRRPPRLRRSRSRCWPRRRSATATGRRSPTRDRGALPRAVAAGPQRPVLRHHQPPVRAGRDRRALRRGRRDRLGQLLEHPGPRAAWPASPAAPVVVRVNAADELPDDLAGIVGVTAGASAPEELVDGGHRPARPRARASRRSASPTRTSTSRRRASCATCWPPSTSLATLSPRRLAPRPPERPGPGPRRPATCSPSSSLA